MKRVTLLLMFLIGFLTSFSQNNEYPKFIIDSDGRKVIAMTPEQAQKLDNNTDLLALYEKYNKQYQKQDSIYIKVINDKDQVIASQKIEVSTLKSQLLVKDQKIQNLQNQINSWQEKERIYEDELINRQSVIKEKDGVIRRLKTKMLVGGIGGGLAIIGLVILVL